MKQASKPEAPRNIVVKVNLSADEFVNYRDKCAAAGVPLSVATRALIKTDLLNANNLTASIVIKKSPSEGPLRSVRLPGRPERRVVRRLRL